MCVYDLCIQTHTRTDAYTSTCVHVPVDVDEYVHVYVCIDARGIVMTPHSGHLGGAGACFYLRSGPKG